MSGSPVEPRKSAEHLLHKEYLERPLLQPFVMRLDGRDLDFTEVAELQTLLNTIDGTPTAFLTLIDAKRRIALGFGMSAAETRVLGASLLRVADALDGGAGKQ